MQTVLRFSPMAGLALALAAGCSDGPEPAARAEGKVAKSLPVVPATMPLKAEPASAPVQPSEPVNPYDGIGDAQFRTMAERVDGLLVTAKGLGGEAKTAIAAAEARASAVIQLEQYRLELTTAGEGKLLAAAKRVASLRPEGSLSRKFFEAEQYDFAPSGPIRVHFSPIQSAWETADHLLRAKLHAGRVVPRTLRAAVATLDPSPLEEFPHPELPDLETRVIRLDLHGDDLLPYLFHCYDVAANIASHRARDAQAHAMINLFAEPLDRAAILHRMYRLALEGNGDRMDRFDEKVRAAQALGALRLTPGVIELDTDELDRAFRIKSRFFTWVKPATEELERLRAMSDVGRPSTEGSPEEVIERNNRAGLAWILNTPHWKSFMQRELTPFVYQKERHRMSQLAETGAKADAVAIESLRQTQARLDDLQQLFRALVPQFHYSFRPVVALEPDGTAAIEPLKPVDIAGLDPAGYITGIHCEIRDGDRIRFWYTHTLDGQSPRVTTP